MKTETFEVNGYQATVLLPENPNGKWVWKTEFFYAFDQAEQALFDLGYTRVYYQISDKFGSPTAVRLMRDFHDELLKRYPFLEEKANLFGFSRGGLYAFNYALYYPKRVKKLYLDAPVLNLKSWPHNGSEDQELFFKEYNLNAQSFKTFCDSPIDHLDEFAKIAPPVLLIAGGKDKVVPFEENGKLLYEKLKNQAGKIELYLKEDCGHHPHSLEDVAPVVEFTEK
jgi:pimeloyl-ACP methyl ester carboxylesterase